MDNNKPKKKRKLSDQTKLKISIKRRARAAMGNNPRKASQSTKRKSLAEELLQDYKKNPEAVKWIKEHMEDLGYRKEADEAISIAKDWGIQTEYNMMHPHHWERKIGSVQYDNEDVNFQSNNPYDMLDDEYSRFDMELENE